MPISLDQFRAQIGNINAGQVVMKDAQTLQKVNSGFFARHFTCFRTAPNVEQNHTVRMALYRAIEQELGVNGRGNRLTGDVDGPRDAKTAKFLADIRTKLGIEVEAENNGALTCINGQALDRASLKSVIESVDSFRSEVDKEAKTALMQDLVEVAQKFGDLDQGIDAGHMDASSLLRARFAKAQELFSHNTCPEDKLPPARVPGTIVIALKYADGIEEKTLELHEGPLDLGKVHYEKAHYVKGWQIVDEHTGKPLSEIAFEEDCFQYVPEGQDLREVKVLARALNQVPDKRERAERDFLTGKRLLGIIQKIGANGYASDPDLVAYMRKIDNEAKTDSTHCLVDRMSSAKTLAETLMKDPTLKQYFSRALETKVASNRNQVRIVSFSDDDLERLLARNLNRLLMAAAKTDDFEHLSQIDQVKELGRALATYVD